jgi:hypothetical protein
MTRRLSVPGSQITEHEQRVAAHRGEVFQQLVQLPVTAVHVSNGDDASRHFEGRVGRLWGGPPQCITGRAGSVRMQLSMEVPPHGGNGLIVETRASFVAGDG